MSQEEKPKGKFPEPAKQKYFMREGCSLRNVTAATEWWGDRDTGLGNFSLCAMLISFWTLTFNVKLLKFTGKTSINLRFLDLTFKMSLNFIPLIKKINFLSRMSGLSCKYEELINTVLKEHASFLSYPSTIHVSYILSSWRKHQLCYFYHFHSSHSRRQLFLSWIIFQAPASKGSSRQLLSSNHALLLGM